jgi:hypothetical protein
VVHEHRAESGHGCHGDTDFSRNNLPVDFPAGIEGAFGSAFKTRDADNGRGYHEDGEAEGHGKGDFLGEADFDLPD